MAYLEVKNLKKSFVTPGGREIKALRDISFDLGQGEILAVVGHNGSGKTTLLNCIRNSEFIDSGQVLVENKAINASSNRVVSVFQDVGLGVIGSMTPMENLALTCSEERTFLWSFPQKRFHRKIDVFLEESGLKDRFGSFDQTPASELSGGQKQQVAIAMAFMRQPQILLLDEFIANLDPAICDEILTWTKKWIRDKNITALMVTHDHQLAQSWTDHVLELCDGEVIKFEATEKSA
jgi:putative ABC transport system ATP-binding protein